MSADKTGSLRRAMAIMRVLANAGGRGAGLTDIARQAQLPHPTAHRLLAQMVEEGMIRRIEGDRRYALGQLTFELGLAAAQHFEVSQVYRPIVSQLARESGDTAYLIVRSGSEAVCIDRRQGASPIRVITLKIGSRRPLGVGAGGLAIIAALPDDDLEDVIRAVALDLDSGWGTSESELRELVGRIRQDGYTLIHNRVFHGVSALGRPIRDSDGRPIAALSVATINQRLPPSRVGELNEHLRRAVHAAETTIAAAALSEAGASGVMSRPVR
jgi:DNA-binding IclR family transcriptional regulator